MESPLAISFVGPISYLSCIYWARKHVFLFRVPLYKKIKLVLAYMVLDDQNSTR